MFERQYVETVLEIAKTLGMTQLEFVKAVWPNKTPASATTTIIALKRQNSRGKPQNLRVSDAIAMAQVIGREYPSLCFEVWEKIKFSSQIPIANASFCHHEKEKKKEDITNTPAFPPFETVFEKIE